MIEFEKYTHYVGGRVVDILEYYPLPGGGCPSNNTRLPDILSRNLAAYVVPYQDLQLG